MPCHLPLGTHRDFFPVGLQVQILKVVFIFSHSLYMSVFNLFDLVNYDPYVVTGQYISQSVADEGRMRQLKCKYLCVSLPQGK